MLNGRCFVRPGKYWYEMKEPDATGRPDRIRLLICVKMFRVLKMNKKRDDREIVSFEYCMKQLIMQASLCRGRKR